MLGKITPSCLFAQRLSLRLSLARNFFNTKTYNDPVVVGRKLTFTFWMERLKSCLLDQELVISFPILVNIGRIRRKSSPFFTLIFFKDRESVLKYGLILALIWMSDKWNRIENLILKPSIDTGDEPLKDSLLDLVNYCLMTVMVLEKETKNAK